MLYTLGQLSQEFPEVADVMHNRLSEADLRLPTKPPSKMLAANRGRAGLPAVPQPGTVSVPLPAPPAGTPGSASQGGYVPPRTMNLGL